MSGGKGLPIGSSEELGERMARNLAAIEREPDSPARQALQEVVRHFGTSPVDASEPAHEWGLEQILRFVRSCGVLISEEDGSELVAELREEGYASSVGDGILRFALHRK